MMKWSEVKWRRWVNNKSKIRVPVILHQLGKCIWMVGWEHVNMSNLPIQHCYCIYLRIIYLFITKQLHSPLCSLAFLAHTSYISSHLTRKNGSLCIGHHRVCNRSFRIRWLMACHETSWTWLHCSCNRSWSWSISSSPLNFFFFFALVFLN